MSLVTSLDVNINGQAATVNLRHGEQASTVAQDFCSRAKQDAGCVKQIADALRERAAVSLRPTAQRAFSTSVAIDGQQRAFEVLTGQHPMDAAILFCQTHASGNPGCAAQLAGAVPASASAEAKAPTESAAEQKNPADAPRAIAQMEVNLDGQAAAVALRHGEEATVVAKDFCTRAP